MERFTVSTYITRRAYIVLSLRQAYRNVFIVFLTSLGIIGLIAMTLGHFNVIDPLLASVIPWPIIFSPVAIPLVFVYIANRMYNENKRLRSEVIYTFSEQRISARTIDADWSYQWDVIRKVEKSGPYFLLYITRQPAELIDATGLTEEQRLFILSGAQRVSQQGRGEITGVPAPTGGRGPDGFALLQQMGFVEYTRVSLQIYRRSKMAKRILIYFAVILVASGILQFIPPAAASVFGWQWQLFYALLFLVMGGIMVFTTTLVIIGINYLVTRRLLKGVTYRFTHWGMERTGVGTDFSLPWRSILKIRETRSFYLFFVSANSAHAIQKRMFRSSEEAAAFRDFLNERMTR